MPPENDELYTGDSPALAPDPEFLDSGSTGLLRKLLAEKQATVGNQVDRQAGITKRGSNLAGEAKTQALSHAERLAGILESQKAGTTAKSEQQQVIEANVLGQRNTSMTQLGGMQTIDQLGAQLPQAMQAARIAQARFDEQQRTANPVLEGLMQALGVKTGLVRAAEEADTSAEQSARIQADRTTLINQMNASNTLANSVGAALNSATIEAQLRSSQQDTQLQLGELEKAKAIVGNTAWTTVYAASKDQLQQEQTLANLQARQEMSVHADAMRITMFDIKDQRANEAMELRKQQFEQTTKAWEARIAAQTSESEQNALRFQMQQELQPYKLEQAKLNVQKTKGIINKQLELSSQRLGKIAGADKASVKELSTSMATLADVSGISGVDQEQVLHYSDALIKQFEYAKEQEVLFARATADLLTDPTAENQKLVATLRSNVNEAKASLEISQAAVDQYKLSMISQDSERASKWAQAEEKARALLGVPPGTKFKLGSTEANRLSTTTANFYNGLPVASGAKSLLDAVALDSVDPSNPYKDSEYYSQTTRALAARIESQARGFKGANAKVDAADAVKRSIAQELRANSFAVSATGMAALPVDMKELKEVALKIPSLADNDFMNFVANRADVAGSTLIQAVEDYVQARDSMAAVAGGMIVKQKFVERQIKANEAAAALSVIYRTKLAESRYRELGIDAPTVPMITTPDEGKFILSDGASLQEYLAKVSAIRMKPIFDFSN